MWDRDVILAKNLSNVIVVTNAFLDKAIWIAISKIHTGEKAFQCEYCEYKFSQKSNLTTHVRVHTGEKPFKCDCCGKCFNQTSSLKSHLKIHAGEKSFKCDFCEKKFTQKGNLKRHLTIHARNFDDVNVWKNTHKRALWVELNDFWIHYVKLKHDWTILDYNFKDDMCKLTLK